MDMKDFELTQKMLSLGGVFYPTGYAFIMFPTQDDAMQVAQEIERQSADSEVMMLTPHVILSQIGKVDDESDVPLPSVGTEGATVRKYVDLARQGHHALMVKVDSDEASEQLMTAARKQRFSYAQRYRMLAIEDLE
jgi:hypothetical protein